MSENVTGTAPKQKRSTVSVVQNVTTAIAVGRDNYLIKGTEDGRGVRLENKAGSVFLPYGAGGKAIVEQLNTLIDAGSGRKRRRTAAEIAAAKETL